MVISQNKIEILKVKIIEIENSRRSLEIDKNDILMTYKLLCQEKEKINNDNLNSSISELNSLNIVNH